MSFSALSRPSGVRCHHVHVIRFQSRKAPYPSSGTTRECSRQGVRCGSCFGMRTQPELDLTPDGRDKAKKEFDRIFSSLTSDERDRAEGGRRQKSLPCPREKNRSVYSKWRALSKSAGLVEAWVAVSRGRGPSRDSAVRV